MKHVNFSYVISKPAKICNITGRIQSRSFHDNIDSLGGTGALLIKEDYIRTNISQSNPGNNNRQGLDFDASLISDIYSNDTNTLNPDSVTCKFFIRY